MRDIDDTEEPGFGDDLRTILGDPPKDDEDEDEADDEDEDEADDEDEDDRARSR
jgi:hypothetical protein